LGFQLCSLRCITIYTLPLEQEAFLVRIPWLEEGFKMTDELLKWCAANKIFDFGFACSSKKRCQYFWL
jgi:hypothetical protein